jgi:hypothetical protein
MDARPHQYIDRQSGAIQTEPLYHDTLVNFFYTGLWERARSSTNLLTRAWTSQLSQLYQLRLTVRRTLIGRDPLFSVRAG